MQEESKDPIKSKSAKSTPAFKGSDEPATLLDNNTELEPSVFEAAGESFTPD